MGCRLPGSSVHGILQKRMLLLLLLSRFSRVRLCATPETAAHEAPPSLGFSRQEHWSRLPLPSPMYESEKWKWSCSVVTDSSWPHGLQPTRLLRPWDFPGKSTGVGCHCFLLECENSCFFFFFFFSVVLCFKIKRFLLTESHTEICIRKSCDAWDLL